MLFGLIDSPIDFIRQNIALYAGLGYAYILLMIFPMYNVIESLDRNQIEAARDMGASWTMIHRRVVIPFAKPGISSGLHHGVHVVGRRAGRTAKSSAVRRACGLPS